MINPIRYYIFEQFVLRNGNNTWIFQHTGFRVIFRRWSWLLRHWLHSTAGRREGYKCHSNKKGGQLSGTIFNGPVGRWCRNKEIQWDLSPSRKPFREEISFSSWTFMDAEKKVSPIFPRIFTCCRSTAIWLIPRRKGWWENVSLPD